MFPWSVPVGYRRSPAEPPAHPRGRPRGVEEALGLNQEEGLLWRQLGGAGLGVASGSPLRVRGSRQAALRLSPEGGER